MIGVSIYLAKNSKEARRAKSSEGKRVFIYFTSLHIPEDDPGTYKELIQIWETSS